MVDQYPVVVVFVNNGLGNQETPAGGKCTSSSDIFVLSWTMSSLFLINSSSSRFMLLSLQHLDTLARNTNDDRELLPTFGMCDQGK
jgi:hypothetical protein